MTWDNDYTPRPTAKVYQIRKAGEIDQAYELAKRLHESSPEDDDVSKAYAWTLIDLCKRYIAKGDLESAQAYSDELSNLSFDNTWDDFIQTILKQSKSIKEKLKPYSAEIARASELSKAGNTEDAMQIMAGLKNAGHLTCDSYETYGWIIFRYLRDKMSSLTSVQFRTGLRDYLNLKEHCSDNLHKQILNLALNYSKQDSNFRFASFFKIWGPEKIDQEAFRESYNREGKKFSPLMSRVAKEVVKYPISEVNEICEALGNYKSQFVDFIRESTFWKLYHLFTDKQFQDLWNGFDTYISNYPVESYHEFHSKILSLAVRTMVEENQWRFYSFFKKWNPACLGSRDWQEEKGENGETYKALALKSIKSAVDSALSINEGNLGDTEWLISAIDEAIKHNPDDDWNVRDKAKLLIKSGRKADAVKVYEELVYKLGDKYYVWQEFSDCIDDTNAKIGMLCKAISMEKNEDFIGNIRLSLAECLLNEGMTAEACHELMLYKDNYDAKGWRVKSRYESLQDRCSGTAPVKNNKELYLKYIPYAEEYAYSSIPYTDLLIIDDWKDNDGKRHVKFTDNHNIEIVINPKRFPSLRKYHKGQIWRIKLYEEKPVQQQPRPFSFYTVVSKPEPPKVTPLLVSPSDKSDWAILPENYGVIDHINKEKKVYHIISQGSQQIFESFENQTFEKGDFVKFKIYKKTVKDETRYFAVEIVHCNKEIGISQFPSRIIAVDGVNETKKLFHYVAGPNLLDGIVHFDQTDIRPNVGDCLKITYYVREKKDSKNPNKQVKVRELLSIDTTDETNDKAIKSISGRLELKWKNDRFGYGYDYEDDEENDYRNEPSADFAFVGDYYVHKDILVKYGICNDCNVIGRAIYTGAGKWKVFELSIER